MSLGTLEYTAQSRDQRHSWEDSDPFFGAIGKARKLRFKLDMEQPGYLEIIVSLENLSTSVYMDFLNKKDYYETPNSNLKIRFPAGKSTKNCFMMFKKIPTLPRAHRNEYRSITINVLVSERMVSTFRWVFSVKGHTYESSRQVIKLPFFPYIKSIELPDNTQHPHEDVKYHPEPLERW